MAAAIPALPTSVTASLESTIVRDKLRHCRRPPSGKPLFAERHVRIICVGAGASGLCFAYKLQRSFRNFSLVIYEKNVDISGTWFENRYPGCACDVPAHNYTYSWEPYPDASAVYISSTEIYRYFKRFADKHNLDQYIRLNHEVVAARWNGASWDVEVRNGQSQTREHVSCDIFINATGVLNNWKWPDIPGLSKFKGSLLHSAKWDSAVSLKDKKVGLIGNGSSGIQILPAIQSIVKSLVTFIRGTTWVSPVQGLGQHYYTEEEKALFQTRPDELRRYRKLNETATNCLFGTFLKSSDTQLEAKSDLTFQMRTKLKNSGLAEKLIPTWSPGCRRLTPGINYLETLGKENVQVELGEVTEITETGCIGSNGVEHELDILICATGFDVSFRPRFPIVSPAGDLQRLWEQDPKSYLGTAAAEVPNYLLFLGPNCPVGNGPVIPVIEAQADYMLKWIDRWQTENIQSFQPKLEAVNEFVEHVDNYMPRTVWTENCRSWYKNGSRDGRIVVLWPGSSLHFIEAMEDPRYDDFTVVYNGNRFAWMGNGYSQTEMDPEADWAYYIRDVDDGPLLSKSARREAMVGGSRDKNLNPLNLSDLTVNGTNGAIHETAVTSQGVNGTDQARDKATSDHIEKVPLVDNSNGTHHELNDHVPHEKPPMSAILGLTTPNNHVSPSPV